MSTTPVIIVGAGGFGREVAWLIDDCASAGDDVELLGFIDDGATSTVEGHPVLGTIDDWLATRNEEARLVCAIGDPIARKALVDRLAPHRVRYGTLVHPSVRRSRWVDVGEGSIICAGCTLTTNVRVGAHTILNLHCTVGHDARLGDFTSAMPTVNISGDVTTHIGAYLGTGATLINGVTIGAWTIVGAGAAVASDLPAGMIAVGIPAKPIKPNARAPRSE